MTEDEARRAKRSGMTGLMIAAVAITFLGLAGPLMLALQGDAEGVLGFYPVGWAIAIGGWLWWLRSRRAARGGERREGDGSPPR
jgi:hypothetical protein